MQRRSDPRRCTSAQARTPAAPQAIYEAEVQSSIEEDLARVHETEQSLVLMSLTFMLG